MKIEPSRQGHGDDRASRRTGRAKRPPSRRSRPTNWACRMDDVLVMHGDTADRAVRHRHLRQPRHGGRRRRALLRAAGTEGQDQEVRRHAAGVRRRHFVRRPVRLQQDRQVASTVAEIAGAAYRAMKLPPNTEPGLVGDPLLGAAELHLPVRRAHRGDGSRPRHRRRSRSSATSRWTIAATSSTR